MDTFLNEIYVCISSDTKTNNHCPITMFTYITSSSDGNHIYVINSITE